MNYTSLDYRLRLGILSLLLTLSLLPVREAGAQTPGGFESVLELQPEELGARPRSVSLNGDIAVLGSPHDVSAYVFYGEDFDQSFRITENIEVGEGIFARSVHSVNDFVLVGVPRSSHGGLYRAGAVYVYKRQVMGGSSRWERVQIIESDRSGEAFGSAIESGTVSLGMQQLVAISAPMPDDTESGRIYLYRVNANGLSHVDTITAGDSGDRFGFPLAMNGRILAACARQGGMAYLYRFTGTTYEWERTIPSPFSGPESCRSIAVGGFRHPDIYLTNNPQPFRAYEDVVVIGHRGEVKTFSKIDTDALSGAYWVNRGTFSSVGAYDQYLGSSVAMSGSLALFAAQDANGGRGEVSFYQIETEPDFPIPDAEWRSVVSLENPTQGALGFGCCSAMSGNRAVVASSDLDASEFRAWVLTPLASSISSVPTEGEDGPAISSLSLAPVAPNPSPGPVIVRYTLPEASHIRLTLVDLLGREVELIADRHQTEGEHFIHWTADRSIPGGMYLVVLETLVGGRATASIVVSR